MDYAQLSMNGGGEGLTVYLPYNPDSTFWNYDLNRQSIDTYGGRVVQLLSVSVSSMILQGVAGSRKKLLQLYSDFRNMQDVQIDNKRSAQLTIPAQFAENGKITQTVWLTGMDVAMDRTTVDYPYKITLDIQEENSNYVVNILKESLASFNWGTSGVGFVDGGYYQGIQSGSSISLGSFSSLLYQRTGV